MRSLTASLKSGWSRASEGNVAILAAGVAYYAFLALIPLIATAILTYGLVVDPATIAAHGEALAANLPAAAGELVAQQVASVAESRGGASGLGLLVAIALSLFGARVAAGAIITALDIAFDAPAMRGFIAATLLALAITLAAVIGLGLVAGATTLATTGIGGGLGALGGLAVVGLAGFGGATLAYRIIPNVSRIPRSAAMRGAALFSLGWLAATAGFGFYASNFGSYNATHGSLGAVIVFLTWLWLSALLLLLGAHVAAASIERP